MIRKSFENGVTLDVFSMFFFQTTTMMRMILQLMLMCHVTLSVPIPLAPSDRSKECSGHGRVVDGKCECEDTFLGNYISRNARPEHTHTLIFFQVIDVNYKWEIMGTEYL